MEALAFLTDTKSELHLVRGCMGVTRVQKHAIAQRGSLHRMTATRARGNLRTILKRAQLKELPCDPTYLPFATVFVPSHEAMCPRFWRSFLREVQLPQALNIFELEGLGDSFRTSSLLHCASPKKPRASEHSTQLSLQAEDSH